MKPQVKSRLSISRLILLTEVLHQAGFSKDEIQAIMGGNTPSVLANTLS